MAGFVLTGAVGAGCAGPPLKAAPPESAAASKAAPPLADVSWSVMEDASPEGQPSQGWLDVHGGQSRAVNRPPELWRQEF